MKKLLSILASVTLVASSASTVLACSDNSNQKVIPEDSKNVETRNKSVDAIKGYVLADQYGLDVEKTNKTISHQKGYVRDDTFATPSVDSFQGLNLSGHIGKSALPLYNLQDSINGLLSKLGINKSVDMSGFIQDLGPILSDAVAYIGEDNIDGAFSLIPLGLNIAAKYIPEINIDPDSVGWIGELIKMNIKYIMKGLNFQEVIKGIISTNQNCTINTIMKTGADALDKLLKVFFNKKYSVEDEDLSVSKFIGTEVLTPLLNNKKIDTDKIKKMFTDPAFYFANISKLIQYSSTFLASVFFSLSFYMPKFEDTPSDVQHLLKDGKTFDDYDNLTVSVDANSGDIKVGDEISNVSFNKAIFGTLKLLTNTDPKSLDVLKLTSVLFHNDKDGVNPLLSKLTFILVDSLKFTDYEIKVSVPHTQVADLGLGKFFIQIDLDMQMKDLFVPKENIKIGEMTNKPLIGKEGHFADIDINIRQNGLGSITDKVFEPLLESILVGTTNKDDVTSAIKGIIGDSSSPVQVTFGKLPSEVLSLVVGLASGDIWKKLGGVVTNLLTNLYYTNGDAFFKGLKDLGIDDETIAGMKAGFGKSLPLANTILDAVKNIPIIGDLTKYEGLIDLDSLLNILDILLMENTIQVPDLIPYKDEDNKDIKLSLVEQITMSINDENKNEIWNKVLGYIPNDDVVNNKWDDSSHYVLRNSFLGNIVDGLYPELDDYYNSLDEKSDKRAIIEDKGDKTKESIGLAFLPRVDSKPMAKLEQDSAEWQKELSATDLNYVVQPLWADKKAWTTENVIDSYFRNSDDIQFESYDLVFNSSSMTVKDADGNILPIHKGRYRIWFSRIDNKSPFEFKKIEKIN